MVPRLIFRTHYQVEEPAYIELIVKRCTSPVQSTYAETVADRLTKEIKRRIGKDFNTAAALYAVDLAAALGVITENNTWTDKGHLVDLLATVGTSDDLILDSREKLLHFRLFLEADGALLIELAKYFLEHRSLSHAEAIAEENDLVEELFSRVFNAYLRLTIATADRMALRDEIQKLQRDGYRPKTRHHKLRIHVQTMFRLGLVDREDSGEGIRYFASEGQLSELSALLREVPNIELLEKRLAKREALLIGARVFGFGIRTFRDVDRRAVCALLAQTYDRINSHGTPVCPISTLVEATQARVMTDCDTCASFDDVLAILKHQQRLIPRQFRFHVDRRGRPAFVKISEDWLQQFRDVTL